MTNKFVEGLRDTDERTLELRRCKRADGSGRPLSFPQAPDRTNWKGRAPEPAYFAG